MRFVFCALFVKKSLNAISQFEAALKEYVRDIGRRRQDLLKIEESLLKKKKEAEKLTAKAKTIASSNPSSSNAKEVELQEEVDKCMVRIIVIPVSNNSERSAQSILKCSTCKQNMRNTVITKCMHCQCATSFLLYRHLTIHPQHSAETV